MARVEAAMAVRKRGSVIIHDLLGVMSGRARSARRSIKGPEFGFGAAMRVRRDVRVVVALLRLKRASRGLRSGSLGGMF